MLSFFLSKQSPQAEEEAAAKAKAAEEAAAAAAKKVYECVTHAHLCLCERE